MPHVQGSVAPSGKQHVPESHTPSDADLLDVIRPRPGASLRQVCGAIWPDLPWSGGTGSDNATGRVRQWQLPPRPGVEGNCIERATAAAWLRDRLEDLVQRGQLRHALRRRDEVDLLASLSYQVPGTELPAGDQAQELLANR